jgi:hypothetical protein
MPGKCPEKMALTIFLGFGIAVVDTWTHGFLFKNSCRLQVDKKAGFLSFLSPTEKIPHVRGSYPQK